MYKVKLIKISDNVNNLRTNVVIGECETLPIIGKPFLMTSQPLETGNIRVIETSKVISYMQVMNEMYFDTQNSKYNLIIISNDTN